MLSLESRPGCELPPSREAAARCIGKWRSACASFALSLIAAICSETGAAVAVTLAASPSGGLMGSLLEPALGHSKLRSVPTDPVLLARLRRLVGCRCSGCSTCPHIHGGAGDCVGPAFPRSLWVEGFESCSRRRGQFGGRAHSAIRRGPG